MIVILHNLFYEIHIYVYIIYLSQCLTINVRLHVLFLYMVLGSQLKMVCVFFWLQLLI